jgi:hypothetical protein
MHATIWHRWIALWGMTLLVLAACGSTEASSEATSSDVASSGAASASATGAGAEAGQTDALVGIWQSDPRSATEVDTYMRDRYTDHQVDEWEKADCAPSGELVVKTLHFGAGQLVVSTATDNGPAHEDWSGTYVVQDADTFLATDGDTPYITVDFLVQGAHLTLNLIEDRFPDHTPWHMAQDGVVLDIGKPLADTMCQTIIYDVSRYTRVG